MPRSSKTISTSGRYNGGQGIEFHVRALTGDVVACGIVKRGSTRRLRNDMLTADEARELATALMEAANEADK